MASEEEFKRGYDESRFIGQVKKDLICTICREVLKNPRFCQQEHPFCHSCILQSLQEKSECPNCREPLTAETLQHPQRFFKETLSELRIKCDYHERGCPDHVQLGKLENHVGQCAFAPIGCEKCGIQINKGNKDSHEKNYCQFGAAKCNDCTEIKENQDRMKQVVYEVKRNQDEMKGNQDEMKQSQVSIIMTLDEFTTSQDVTNKALNEFMTSQDEIKQNQERTNNEMNEVKARVSGIKRKHHEIDDKVNQMNGNIGEVKASQNEMKRKQDEIDDKVGQMKANVGEIKQTQTEMKEDQVAFKAEMRQQFEQVKEMMKQILQGTNNNNIQRAQAIDAAVAVHSVINQDIIILGGSCAKPLNTVETFNLVKQNSVQLPPMTRARAAAASCVYNNDVIVTGGYDGKDCVETIEILKMNQHPLRWKIFDGRLPAKLFDHSAIVNRDKLIIIGGCNVSEKNVWDAIYEMRLTPPYTSKLLVRMPQPRRNHGSNLVNGRLYILAGTTTGFGKDAMDSVIVYDFLTNECKPCPSLPRAVWGMSTVTWGNSIVLIGGAGKNNEDLNDVIMYDTESGRSERLPSMIYKRSGCSAVIMDDVIVVFGGFNKEQGYLNSVERFTMGSDGWKELSLRMKEKRNCASAVVKPNN